MPPSSAALAVAAEVAAALHFGPRRRRSPTPRRNPAEGNFMQCHKVDYEILGSEMQIVEVELDPGETVVAEAGAMNYMEDGIEFTAKMGDGSDPEQGFFGKLASAGKRMLTGESIFLTHFTNHAPVKRRVAFAAPYPGKILALDLAKIGSGLTCQKDSFLCAALGTKIGIAFQKRLGAGFFGGEGFILEKLEGDGMAFIHAGGHVIKTRRERARARAHLERFGPVLHRPGIDDARRHRHSLVRGNAAARDAGRGRRGRRPARRAAGVAG
jgi:uncharacterized protein (AIM24 family)